MSLPEWNGDPDARVVEWDGIRIPAVKVISMKESGWVALLPMENGCVMDLHLDVWPEDEPYCWVTMSYEATGYAPGEGYGKEDVALWPDPRSGTIRATVAPLGWTCDVEGPDEVLKFLQLWGSLPVVPA